MYQCVHYIKYTSIYKVHVPMCPLYKVHLYNTKYMYQCVHYIKYTSIYKVHVPMCPLYKEISLCNIQQLTCYDSHNKESHEV